MAHFAKIENEKVTEVIVINNFDCAGGVFPESEPVGQEYINNVLGLEGEWIQTSYNGNFRRRYAANGYNYDRDYDVFYPEPIKEDWILDKETWQWITPEGHRYPRD